jgi:hypothetical protein
MKMRKIHVSFILVMALLIAACSDDNTATIDVIDPKVLIQSPISLFTYSTDLGNSLVPYRVTLTAQGTDETKIVTLQLIVTDNEGTIVLEKTNLEDADSPYILDVSEGFETTNTGTYNAKFIATDASGNVTSESTSFTYED